MAKHPVPKRKTSKSRTSSRYNKFAFEAVKKLKNRVNLSTCPECGQKKLNHYACPECGTYRGRQVVNKDKGDNITTIKPSNMATYRHLARIAVAQTIFAYEFRGGNPKEILEYITKELHPKLQELDFAEEILQGIIKEYDKIKSIIQENAPEWPIEKIARIDRAALEIGIYELIYMEDVPPIVSINEAIEIAKLMGEVNAGRFVNGVLSSVMNKYCETKPTKEEKNG